MLDLISYALLALMVVTWLTAVASAWELLSKHRPEGRGFSDYLQGAAWFGADAFAPSGAAARRRMHMALAVFFLIAFGVAGVVIASEVGNR